MKPNKGSKIVALLNSYGFQGRYWKKGQIGTLSTDKEVETYPKKHFRVFSIADVKADAKSKEQKEKDEKEKLAAQQAIKKADDESKKKSRKEADERAAAKRKEQEKKDKAASKS